MRIPPPIYALAAAAIMWQLQQYIPLASTTALWPWLIGWVMVLSGVAIDLAAVWQFKQNRTTINPLRPEKTTTIVDSGLYRLSRNPMYTGLLLTLTGLVFLLRALSPIAVLPIFMWLITHFQIKPEEQILLDKFADEYRQYLLRTPRWF